MSSSKMNAGSGGPSRGDSSSDSSKRRSLNLKRSNREAKVSVASVLCKGEVTSWNARLCHQRISLSLAYRRDRYSGEGVWGYEGKNTMYLIDDSDESASGASVSADGVGPKSGWRDLALHLRGSCKVLSMEAHIVRKRVRRGASNKKRKKGGDGEGKGEVPGVTEVVELEKIPVIYAHHDPLRRVLLRPAQLFSPTDFAPPAAGETNPRPRRFEADAHCTRDTAGMTDAIRAASIASCTGELRVAVGLGTDGSTWDSDVENDSKIANENGESPLTAKEAEECWKKDLLKDSVDAWNGVGLMERRARTTLDQRQQRRTARINLVSRRLGGSSVTDQEGGGGTNDTATTITNTIKLPPRAIKLTVRFRVPKLTSGPHHLGGLHVLSSPRVGSDPAAVPLSAFTPHIYTSCGVFGDHQGPRCWVPTLDSATSRHRASHELTVMVTSHTDEGLWAAGCGEDFGVFDTILHPMRERQSNQAIVESIDWEVAEKRVVEALGSDHHAFTTDFLSQSDPHTSTNAGNGARDGEAMAADGVSPHVVPLDIGPSGDSHDQSKSFATSVWVTSTWSSCPARSLGFAVGPFRVLYDPEYYSQDDDDEDDDDEKNRMAVDYDVAAITGSEMAVKTGEGIRQLYLAPVDERHQIHARAPVIRFDGASPLPPNTSSSVPRHIPGYAAVSSLPHRKHLVEVAILGSTTGVPNRTLALMRELLALPVNRTASYTQIWIPDAVDGGMTPGALHCSSDIMCNPFEGGSIIDSTMLPPPGHRLPFHIGGRNLQFFQARGIVRGWIYGSLPLSSRDDVGQGYLHALIEAFLMSLYARSHGAAGEGGGRGSFYYCERYSGRSGMNSLNLDFLPVRNVEDDLDVVASAGGPVEERSNDYLWRSATNGTESHTTSGDEFSICQLLSKDVLDYFERNDKGVPLPSMEWMGSRLSATFLSSNSTSSSALGCGALELMHPIGGLVYRFFRCDFLRKVIEGRADVSNFLRAVRAFFVASILEDQGEEKIVLPTDRKPEKESKDGQGEDYFVQRPPFVVSVEEIIRKGGLSHALFTRCLRLVGGPIREGLLRGTLIDVDREIRNAQTNRNLVEPEAFPNSYVRSASALYLRVGTHVEAAGASSGDQQGANQSAASAAKGIQLFVFAEPVIPEGGCTFDGAITLRVVENEGQCREFVRALKGDGSRCDWGPIFLHAKPVTTAKQQSAASGVIEAQGSSGAAGASEKGNKDDKANVLTGTSSAPNSAFTSDHLHSGGYQALELVRLTNRSPLLWVRVDPQGTFNGRVSIFQPDACWAEQLFHDGEAASQVEALRALAERPLRIQGSVKISSVYDVDVSTLPVRILGDCLRGSKTLHSDLPHNPAVRAQAALAIAQWQNNKAPNTYTMVGGDVWLGVEILGQYFKERHYSHGTVMPVRFNRWTSRKGKRTGGGVGSAAPDGSDGGDYVYLDIFDKAERHQAIEEADLVEAEEDEEYRVRSAVITAVSCIRAKDGMTPASVLRFMETVLDVGDGPATGHMISPQEGELLRKNRRRQRSKKGENDKALDQAVGVDEEVEEAPFVASTQMASALLALCHLHVRPAMIDDPATGTQVQSKAPHPILPLLNACTRILEWDLYKEDVRAECDKESMTGVGNGCYAVVTACAVTALSNLALLKQCTTNADGAMDPEDDESMEESEQPEKFTNAQYYVDIFDSRPLRADTSRAAAAQALACICCAADRHSDPREEHVGLLTALEFLMERILEVGASPALRQTLASIMLDACTGKVCSMQRAAAVGSQTDIYAAGARFVGGGLGASYGGDNGSAMVTTVSELSHPAARAVNDGARSGLRLLKYAGRESGNFKDETVVRVAKFATSLWRTMNGECTSPTPDSSPSSDPFKTFDADGVCAFDGHLRCSLVALWQWIWPTKCFAVMRVQSWAPQDSTGRYKRLGADQVMKATDEERQSVEAEDAAFADLRKLVERERDRQKWRGEMASCAFEYARLDGKVGGIKDPAAAAQGIGEPLPVVEKDAAWRMGGWTTSAALQRRSKGADGGSAVTKLRLTVKASGSE